MTYKVSKREIFKVLIKLCICFYNVSYNATGIFLNCLFAFNTYKLFCKKMLISVYKHIFLMKHYLPAKIKMKQYVE